MCICSCLREFLRGPDLLEWSYKAVMSHLGARNQASSLRIVGAFDHCTMSVGLFAVVFNAILSILNVFILFYYM